MKKPAAEPKPAPRMTSIHMALANINRDIDAIPKDNQNQAQGFNFRGIDDFYNALHPIFAAHGVVCIPNVLDTSFDKWLNAKQNNVFCARVRVQYNFTASDGSMVSSVGVGEAYDFGDKALNKAMSMAHKYVLAQMFQIPTATPDGDAYTYDTQTNESAAPADPYAGKTLDQLVILRDEYMEAKQVVPQTLLGKIAELKADAQDATPEKPAKPRKTNGSTAKATAPAAPATPAPTPEKPATPVAPPAPTRTAAPEMDLPPDAAPEPEPEPESDGFEGEAPANDRMAAALNFLIEPTALKHKDYAGRTLGQLSKTEVETLHDKWYLKFREDIDKTPVKAALRDALLIVKEGWDAQQ